MTHPGERKVRAADQIATIGGIGEGEFVLACGHRAIDVVSNRHGRILELHRRNVDDVSPQHELLALGLHNEHGVPWRMAVRRSRTDAGDQLGFTLEYLSPASRDIRTNSCHSGLKETLRRFWS